MMPARGDDPLIWGMRANVKGAAPAMPTVLPLSTSLSKLDAYQDLLDCSCDIRQEALMHRQY